MRVLDPATVTEWVAFQAFWIPRSLDTVCPHCRRAVNLALEAHCYDPARKTVAANARCAGCGKSVCLWIIEPVPQSSASKKGAQCIAIYPGTQTTRAPIEGSDLIPDELRDAYKEVVQVYNAGVWAATLTLCRRTLEGIVLHLNKQSGGGKQSLAQMLRELPQQIDLGKPITSLADSVRLGGNIGAHYTETHPSRRLATTMLDLLEYLLEYFFTIPKLIEKATEALDKS
jgi:hypothetical protein